MTGPAPISKPLPRAAPVAVAVLMCLTASGVGPTTGPALPTHLEAIRVAAVVAGLQHAVRDWHTAPTTRTAAHRPTTARTAGAPRLVAPASPAPDHAPCAAWIDLARLNLPPPVA